MHDVIDLPIERVNALSPYKVYINNNGSLGFETQYGSVYEVGFVEDYTFMDENAFQFFILESQGKHSVKDPLVRETIWVILETFFLENNPVILYICDMSDGKQAIRNRLFSMWYYEYEQRESFTFLSTKVEVESTDFLSQYPYPQPIAFFCLKRLFQYATNIPIRSASKMPHCALCYLL